MIDRIADYLKIMVRSCMANKKNTLLFICLIFLFGFFMGFIDEQYSMIPTAIYFVIYISYGMQYAGELINGREYLPGFSFKDIPRGIKASVVLSIYWVVQGLILMGISILFNFPSFEIESFFFEFSETVHLIFTHSPIDSVLFFILSIAVTYIMGFFLDIDLANLLDDGKFIDSFNFKLIKHYIDNIGWMEYAKDYTALLLTVLIITGLEFIPVSKFVMFNLSLILVFMVEFCAINVIFKKMKA